MKNFKTIFKSARLLAGCLLVTAIGHAQTVTVPSGCTVISAGTGGNASLGIVGDSGVVLMPDPSGGGTFTFNPPSGVTTASWFLRGDLSNSTASPFYNAPTQPAAGLTANIITYNKNFRSASSEGSNPSWARSKGTVRVSYTVPGCGSSITFEVFKTFTSVPAIVGPNCLEPNKTYTYSIDQVASDNANDNIGFDKYYWSGLPTGAINSYFSADNSSITFTTPSSFSPFVLKCCVGKYNTTSNVDGGNGPDPTVGVTYLTCSSTPSIINLPKAPAYTTAPPTCHPTGVASFNIVYPNPTSGTYTWTAPSTGWLISSSSTATTTTVTVTTPNNNPGGLVLTITGTPCNAVIIPYQVNRSLTGAIITPGPSSPGSTCMLAGTSGNQFYLGGNATANNTTWTITSVPSTATGVTLGVVTGQPSSTVAVNIASNATINATYTLTATANTSPACNSTSASYTFNVKPLTPAISGTSCVVKGALTAQTYTCTASTGASYVWSFPAGWTAGSFTTATNSITVTPASATAVLNGVATVTAIGMSGCNSAVSANFPINYSPIAPNAITFSNSCFNAGLPTSGTITVTNAPSPFYGSYTVTSSPAGLFSATSYNVTTGVISFTTSATASGTYQVTIAHGTTSCGSAQNATAFPVSITGNGATIPVPTLDSTPGFCDVYKVTGAPTGSAIQWFLNGSATPLVSNGTTIFITPNGLQLQLCGDNTTITSVCAQATSGGCTTRVCAPNVGTHGTAKTTRPDQSGQLEGLTIYPNPNDGNFIIQADNVKESALATLTDMTGKKLDTYRLVKGENKIRNKNLAAGTYIVILQIDGKTESRKLIIK